MNPLALGGLLIAFGGIVFVIIVAGSSPAALWDLSSFVLVLGGTVGITMMTLPSEDVIIALKLMGKAFANADAKYQDTINLFVELAEQARKDGLLSLEERISRIDNPFIQKGMQLLVDGTDPNLIREMLEMDIEQLSNRHAKRYGVLELMGGYAPTMGMLGTVIGIIFTLANLTTPDEIGAKVAIAFITTLYGALFANFLFLPIGGRLKQISKLEVSERELALEGMLAVQAGDNPQIVKQKLEAFLPVGARNRPAGEK
ncbi:MAG: motility protein A [Caldilineaceae bacterium]|nr:motility protein A [Caldilineaceae bacterium]HRJ43641.1 motility protein A [Caldilineaceae bacterium]